jgi:hypothetical protein
MAHWASDCSALSGALPKSRVFRSESIRSGSVISLYFPHSAGDARAKLLELEEETILLQCEDGTSPCSAIAEALFFWNFGI